MAAGTAAGMAASAARAAAAKDEEVHMSLEEAGMLPPVTLMSSTADIIVPWCVCPVWFCS